MHKALVVMNCVDIETTATIPC